MALPVALAVLSVAAHIAPSPTENNRYAKITLLPDRLRLVYTVYFGERPGAAERRRMDLDRDGAIAPAEAETFARSLLQTLAPAVTLELDGRRLHDWSVADVGLGTPQVAGASFSVDLALSSPLPPGVHTLWLADDWPIPSPGESEVRIEAAPGVTVQQAHLGRDGQGAMLQFTFRGLPERAGARGIYVAFRVPAHAPTPRRTSWLVLAVLGTVGVLLIAWQLSGRRTGSSP